MPVIWHTLLGCTYCRIAALYICLAMCLRQLYGIHFLVVHLASLQHCTHVKLSVHASYMAYASLVFMPVIWHTQAKCSCQLDGIHFLVVHLAGLRHRTHVLLCVHASFLWHTFFLVVHLAGLRRGTQVMLVHKMFVPWFGTCWHASVFSCSLNLLI